MRFLAQVLLCGRGHGRRKTTPRAGAGWPLPV